MSQIHVLEASGQDSIQIKNSSLSNNHIVKALIMLVAKHLWKRYKTQKKNNEETWDTGEVRALGGRRSCDCGQTCVSLYSLTILWYFQNHVNWGRSQDQMNTPADRSREIQRDVYIRWPDSPPNTVSCDIQIHFAKLTALHMCLFSQGLGGSECELELTLAA